MDTRPVQASPVPESTNKFAEVNRRSANYHPTVWGDYFLKYSDPDFMKPNLEVEARIQQLKCEVKAILRGAKDKPSKEMVLIDALQRLGVDYHFEKEIKDALQSIYNNPQIICDIDDDDNLYVIALHFRLLRQQGYHVSSDTFKEFKDEKGDEFKQKVRGDAKTLLCLYEATHLGVHGEEILEEAMTFSINQLKSMLPHLDSPLSEQVLHALEVPLYKRMPRLEARRYIPVYQADEERSPIILELAKLDFNLSQTLHQREIGEISRWWKEIEIPSKLPFARDRLVECYFWILGVYFEPKHSIVRSFMTKVIALASVIDDIYDVYGTLEELELFTHAIERWEREAITDLPEYMQVCFKALLDVMKEMEERMIIHEGRSYPLYYSKEAVKGLVKAYFFEAKWFSSGYVPSFEEYIRVSVMSSGYPMLAVQSLLGMWEFATHEAFEWILSVPKIVKSSALIARLVDDIQTYKVEQERGDAPSGVQCYMREHNVSEEEACERIRQVVEITWKDINEELQKPSRPGVPSTSTCTCS